MTNEELEQKCKDYRKFILGMEGMSPEEIQANYTMTSKEGTRSFTPKEANDFYDILHQTEKAKRTFTLNDIEYANAVAFAEKHKGCLATTAMSEKFEYAFYPGSIGTAKVIKCLICKEEENITDFDCW